MQGFNVIVHGWEDSGVIVPVCGFIDIYFGLSIMKFILWGEVLVIIIVSTRSDSPYLQFLKDMLSGIILQHF